jgi:hypothetical protein
MEAMWPNVTFAETTTTRHLSSGPRMARSTHLTASNAPFTSSLRDVSTVAARSSGMARKSTAACSVVRTVHDMRQLDTALATEAPANIAVFDWLVPALELARTDGLQALVSRLAWSGWVFAG